MDTAMVSFRRWAWRRGIVLLGMLLTLSGCAVSQRTLAEQLAAERWDRCSHFDNISLDRIESSGMIWYGIVANRIDPDGPAWTSGADEGVAFQRCLVDALKEQARAGRFNQDASSRVTQPSL